MDNGEFDDVDDDPTLVEDPGPTLDDTIRRAAQLIGSMQANLQRLREADRDTRRFIAPAVYSDMLKLAVELELAAPLVRRDLER